MAQSTFDGPVISKNGFYSTGPGLIKNIPDGTNTITLTVADYAGRIITTNDASLVITLPTISAAVDSPYAGPGADPNNPNNLGATFTFLIETAATALKIQTDGTDKFIGSLVCIDTDDANTLAYAPAATNDVISLNGTTTGGIVGTVITITAVDALKYLVQGTVIASGIVATPFADS